MSEDADIVAAAIAAVERCAFEDPDGRRVVHCFLGRIGADWDAEEAIAEIGTATRVWWGDTLLGRCLHVETNEPSPRRYVFDTVRPC